MKIYILADMEGVSGIRRIEEVQLDSAEYPHGRQLMMAEINAAIDAAYAAGATEVIACDTHAGGGQIQIDKMDERARYETPAPGRLLPALDDSYAGLILLGHHARAGTLNGFLDHTMNSAAWYEYRINDVVVGEIGILAACAGHHRVPVVAVTGDAAAAAEARELLGDVETAVVKWGLGRNRARCLSLPRAHAAVREAITRALGAIDRFKPYQPSLPATVRLTLYRSDMADERAQLDGVRRLDARTLEKSVESLLDVRPW